MRLIEAILQANQRAVTTATRVAIDSAAHADALPLAALTCLDARLNRWLPEVLGIPAEAFLWLRNAGNIITGPISSTTRSLALACAVKGGKEIAIIGHTDCRVGQTTTLQLVDAFARLGVPRARLPENLTDYFGLFASEQQNVIKAVGIVRSSPLLGVRIPVHGLLLDTLTGRLTWLVNGYETLPEAGLQTPPGDSGASAWGKLAPFELGEMRAATDAIGAGSGLASKPVEPQRVPPPPARPAPPLPGAGLRPKPPVVKPRFLFRKPGT